jgi:hypothetical protein
LTFKEVKNCQELEIDHKICVVNQVSNSEPWKYVLVFFRAFSNALFFSGRDHGLPTFLQARKKCGFKADFKTFDDLLEIFPKKNVDLLKSSYNSVDDIDLLVGGSLETFKTIDSTLAGDTLGCAIGENYKRLMGGDAYFYSHKTNPHPFTQGQINAVEAFTFLHLICKNSNLDSVNRIWFLFEMPSNPKVLCKDLQEFNFNAFKV